MAADRFVLTREGKERLERELEELRLRQLPRVRERLREALEASHGDTADQAEYVDAQWEQARIEGRIAELERLLARAELIETPSEREVAALGSTVVIRNEGELERYTLVGPAEADPRQGRLSVESPVGRALLGHRRGDVVEVATPAGLQRLELVDIE